MSTAHAYQTQERTTCACNEDENCSLCIDMDTSDPNSSECECGEHQTCAVCIVEQARLYKYTQFGSTAAMVTTTDGDKTVANGHDHGHEEKNDKGRDEPYCDDDKIDVSHDHGHNHGGISGSDVHGHNHDGGGSGGGGCGEGDDVAVVVSQDAHGGFGVGGDGDGHATVDVAEPVAQACASCVDASDAAAVSAALPHATVRTRLHVRNICCEAEVRLIEATLKPMTGVAAVKVNALTRTALVDHCPVACCAAPEALVEKLNAAHLGASLVDRLDAADAAAADAAAAGGTCSAMRAQPDVVHVAAVWACYLGARAAHVFAEQARSDAAAHNAEVAMVALLIVATVVGAAPLVLAAARSLRRRTIDMNALMSLAIAGALGAREWEEAALVTVLFVSAGMVEKVTMGRVERALATATALSTPTSATRADTGVRVPLAGLLVGDVIALRPGEQAAIDGVVAKGRASVSEAAVTGEAAPLGKAKGDAIISGSVVLDGYLEVALTSLAAESSLAQLSDAVAEAQAHRGRAQVLVDTFAQWWTPAVLVAVVALITVCPALAPETEWLDWLERALVLLVLACPCALVLAAPIPTTCAIANAARHGVLIKRAEVVEQLAAIGAVALDKTGTLTLGDFEVLATRMLGDDADNDSEATKHELLRLAAAVEACSAHPLASAVVTAAVPCIADLAADGSDALPSVSGFRVLEGVGVRGDVESAVGLHGTVAVLVGNAKALLAAADPGPKPKKDAAPCAAAPPPSAVAAAAATRARARFDAFCAARAEDTCLAVAVDGQPVLALALNDTVRPEARAAVAKLRALGCETMMLTGDVESAAAPVARALALDGCKASCLPADKHTWVVEREGRAGDGTPTAMLGDGINDATALAAATVGVAMGAGGTALAAKSADVVILSDNVKRLPQVIALARRTRRAICVNIAFAAGVKVGAVVAALSGDLKLWMAVLIDVGSLLVVLGLGSCLLVVEDVWTASAADDDAAAIENVDAVEAEVELGVVDVDSHA